MAVLIALLLGASLLLASLALPLIRRRVPPNRLYGLRVPATFADEGVWYEANARSGKDLVRLAAVMALVALALPIAGLDADLVALVWVATLTFAAVFTAAVGWLRANRLLRTRHPPPEPRA